MNLIVGWYLCEKIVKIVTKASNSVTISNDGDIHSDRWITPIQSEGGIADMSAIVYLDDVNISAFLSFLT